MSSEPRPSGVDDSKRPDVVQDVEQGVEVGPVDMARIEKVYK